MVTMMTTMSQYQNDTNGSNTPLKATRNNAGGGKRDNPLFILMSINPLKPTRVAAVYLRQTLRRAA